MEAGPSRPQREGPLDFAGSLNERGIGGALNSDRRAAAWDNRDFVSLSDSIDTTTASGRFFFNVMASLAQMERELMVERTQAGLQAARDKAGSAAANAS